MAGRCWTTRTISGAPWSETGCRRRKNGALCAGIPTHQFLFNAGSVDKRFYMENLQLEPSEFELIRYPQRGVCLYKCGNERYLLEVHAPPYKEKLFGTAGGR